MLVLLVVLQLLSPAAAGRSRRHGRVKTDDGLDPPPRKLTPAEIAPYPPMQWHSWGLFTSEDLVTEANMNEMAEALVSSGLAKKGYKYVNVDEGWLKPRAAEE